MQVGVQPTPGEQLRMGAPLGDPTVLEHQDQVGDVKLTGFVRFEVGEGIEKDEANLADEVAAALKG